MELLIPGLILVALMVYASTRIKRNAAAAWEEETIETDDFTLVKPAGYLHVLNGDERYAFEAYSKEFSTVGQRDVRQATSSVTVLDATAGEAVNEIKNAATEITSETNEVIGEYHYTAIETVEVRHGTDHSVFYKIGERDGQVYKLESAAMSSASEEQCQKAASIADSFVLKTNSDRAASEEA